MDLTVSSAGSSWRHELSRQRRRVCPIDHITCDISRRGHRREPLSGVRLFDFTKSIVNKRRWLCISAPSVRGSITNLRGLAADSCYDFESDRFRSLRNPWPRGLARDVARRSIWVWRVC